MSDPLSGGNLRPERGACTCSKKDRLSCSPPVHVVSAAILAFVACGPKPEPVQPEQPQPEPVEDVEAQEAAGMQIVGITGSLSQNEVNDAMTMKAIPAFNLCFEHYLAEREYLAGKVRLGFIVLDSGKTQQVKLLESSYGDTELEKCFLGKAKFVKFPKPHGGATEVSWEFSTDVIDGVKKPIVMNAQKLRAMLEPFVPEIEACLGGPDAGYSLTFHVGDSMTEEVENDSGKIVSVTTSSVLTLGGCGPDGTVDGIDCVLEASKNWKLEADVDGVQKATLQF